MMYSREENTPLLIVGCRRSGTTLLRTIFEGHPDLLVHPDEPQFFLELFRKYGFSKMNAMSAIKHIVDHPYRAPTVGFESFSGVGTQLRLSELANWYLKAWMTGQSGKRPLLKDPLFVFHLETALRLFPDCTVINIVRDPRANVSSQRLRWPQFSVWTCAMYWRKAVRAAANWGAHHPERYMVVSYEALVQNPESTIRGLCDELCLPYVDSLLTFRQKEVIFEPSGGSRIKQFTAPDPSRQNLWKEHLSEEDIQLIEVCCADEMAALGYKPVTSGKLSLTLQQRRLRERVAYRFYEFGSQSKNVLRRLSGQLQSFASRR